jgi:hypothetical protein
MPGTPSPYSGFHSDVWHMGLGSACPPRKSELEPIHLLGNRSKIGWREQAGAELSTAIDLYRSMEMTFGLPQAEAALADMGG